jgi:hypothetical protein
MTHPAHLLIVAAAVSAAQSSPPAPAPPPPNPVAVAAEYRDAVAGGVSLLFVNCASDEVKGRIARAGERFRAVRPFVISVLGEPEAGRIGGEVLADPANLYTPGCPRAEELERRLSTLESHVAALEVAAAQPH